jgi:SAM-dependent methyltransferase
MRNMRHWLIYKILWQIRDACFKIIFLPSVIFEVVKEHFEDRRLGIEADEEIFRKDESLHKDKHIYSPTYYSILKRVFDHLELEPDDVFVDLGCGKGRVCFFAAERNVKKVIGIDLDEDMLDIAKDNLRNLRIVHAPVEFIRADAAAFDPIDGTVFFMYDPFGYRTVLEVIKNIKRSFTARPRKIRIIYYAPVFRHIFDSEDWLEVESEIMNGETIVWRAVSGKEKK